MQTLACRPLVCSWAEQRGTCARRSSVLCPAAFNSANTMHHALVSPRTGCSATGLPDVAVKPARMRHVRDAATGTATRAVLAEGPVASSSTASQAQPNAHGPKSGAVIVGGGPAGLAAALMLAKRGWRDITVLEKRASFVTADSDKAFVYMIDGRSERVLKHFGLADQLPILGWPTNEANVICAHPDGSVTKRKFPIKDKSIVAHYVHRVKLLKLLVQAAQEMYPGAIHLVSSAHNLTIRRPPGSGSDSNGSTSSKQPLVVEADVCSDDPSAAGNHITLHPQLLLGCDGLRSSVRAALADFAKQDAPSSDRFSMVQMPSPSTGLRFKVLLLPPSPTMRNGQRLQNDSLGLIYSCHKPRSLAMWPEKDPNGMRSANLVVYADDPVWDIKTAEGMYAWMEDNFPQVDMRALVPPDAMQAYAASRGGYFPAPQYSKGLGCVLPAAGEDSKAATAGASSAAGAAAANGDAAAESSAHGCGAVLLGDAAHAFPPDMAAGVNSALEDVWVLDQALVDAGDDVATALKLYEERRTDDVRALVRLVQIAGPFQYGVAAVRKKIWQMLFVVQLLLNQVAPAIFWPPIMIMIQNSKLPYSEILRRANVTALRVKVLLAACVGLAAAMLRRAV